MEHHLRQIISTKNNNTLNKCMKLLLKLFLILLFFSQNQNVLTDCNKTSTYEILSKRLCGGSRVLRGQKQQKHGYGWRFAYALRTHL